MSRRFLLYPVAIFVLFSIGAFADSQARIVRLSYLDGDVQIDRGDTHGFSQAFLNMPLTEGVRLWTRGDAHAEVEFEDDSTARLIPDTIVSFQKLRLSDERRVTVLSLQEGELYLNLKKHNDDIRIQTGQEELVPAKSAHFRLLSDQGHLSLAVFHGEVDLLQRNGQRVRVRKDESVSLNFSDPDRYYLAHDIQQDPQDVWDREREEDARVVLRNAYNTNYSGYSSAYSYGSADLYQYGSFSTFPGYGELWRPFDVGYGWQPFGSGYWVFYPSQGYVWVSPYPWGWTPYRYGSWINIPGQGWYWQPGNNWSQWSPTPVYVNPPRQFTPPPPPPPSSGSGVVQVGGGSTGIIPPRPERGHRFNSPNPAVSSSSTLTVSPSSSSSTAMPTASADRRTRDTDRQGAAGGLAQPARIAPMPASDAVRMSRSARDVAPTQPVYMPLPPQRPQVAPPPTRIYVPPPAPSTRAPEMRPPRMPSSPPPAVSRGERSSKDPK